MSGYVYNVGQLFSKVVSEHKERIAIKHLSGELCSYQQLDELSDKVATYYNSCGIAKGDVIAIFNNKSTLGYACILAALKVGAIYTNLDTTSPYERLKKILERCKPALIVYDIPLEYQEQVGLDFDVKTVELFGDFEAQLHQDFNGKYDCNNVVGSDPAYIMFTSGSTGFPKGAVITHANLLNFISWGQNEYGITPNDVFTNVNPIYFDNSVFDLYMSLLSGAQLVPFTNDVTKDPFRLVAEVEKAGCTSWFSVPSLLVYLLTTKAISQGKLQNIQRFIFGGEGFPKSKLKKLHSIFENTATLYNVYGPTECTCICSSYTISAADFEDMNNLAPLGKLAGNFDYILLDTTADNPEFGELGLKGPNVGAGYYNDAERASKSFIQNPECKYNEVIYRTGDLVERDEQGLLHFKGRADNQVKHMGYRIELEEIESVLNTLQYVNETAVVYEKLGEGLGQILCYVSISAEKTDKEILEDLKNLVPEYMLPKKVFILPELPKNQNGKIDRIALKEKK